MIYIVLVISIVISIVVPLGKMVISGDFYSIVVL